MSLIKRERRSMWPVEMVWPDERIDRVFRDMFRDFFAGDGSGFEDRPMLLRVEEFVEDGTCVIRAELPGLDPDKDVEISVVDGILHLRAVREERKEEEKPNGFRSEFHYGSFVRNFRLPEGTTEADVKAGYKDGILEVRVPLPKPVTPAPAVKIPIERG